MTLDVASGSLGAFGVRASSRPAQKKEIAYFYGIRGMSALYVMLFHLNYLLLEGKHGPIPAAYEHLTNWMRYGDFRVAAFFVISGFLLMLPAAKSATWQLPSVEAFFHRRFERLLAPYYVALAISVVLFVAWLLVMHMPVKPLALAVGTAAHVLMIHNLHPLTNLYINDALWNLALEFQCYALFAFVFLPVLQRFGPWAQLAVAAGIGLAPHFLFHGLLDWTRPWFIVLYSMGVLACALLSPVPGRFQNLVSRVPWGWLWLAFGAGAIVQIVRSPIDTTYAEGIFQNLTLGAAVTSFVMYTQTGYRGGPRTLAHAIVKFLEFAPLGRLGRFSYSLYLIHFPILRLLVGITSGFTDSIAIQGALALFVYIPLTVLAAYAFHLKFELPFQRRKPAAATAAAAV